MRLLSCCDAAPLLATHLFRCQRRHEFGSEKLPCAKIRTWSLHTLARRQNLVLFSLIKVNFFAVVGKTGTVSNSSRRKTDASLQSWAARAAVIGHRPQLGIVQDPSAPARDPWRVPLPHQGRPQSDRTRRARDRDRPRRITPPLAGLCASDLLRLALSRRRRLFRRAPFVGRRLGEAERLQARRLGVKGAMRGRVLGPHRLAFAGRKLALAELRFGAVERLLGLHRRHGGLLHTNDGLIWVMRRRFTSVRSPQKYL